MHITSDNGDTNLYYCIDWALTSTQEYIASGRIHEATIWLKSDESASHRMFQLLRDVETIRRQIAYVSVDRIRTRPKGWDVARIRLKALWTLGGGSAPVLWHPLSMLSVICPRGPSNAEGEGWCLGITQTRNELVLVWARVDKYEENGDFDVAIYQNDIY